MALSFAKERPTWQVTGSDLSEHALRVARRNALALNVVWNIDFVHSDLCAALPARTHYDLIAANPPYISDEDMLALAPDIRDHEPPLALRGGADGLVLLRRLVKEAVPRLGAGGILALEVGAGQAPRLAKGLASYGLANVEIERDYGGIQRVVSGIRPPMTRSAGEPVETTTK